MLESYVLSYVVANMRVSVTCNFFRYSLLVFLISIIIIKEQIKVTLRANSPVPRRLPNEGSDGADATPGDSPFQTRAATTGKARSPTAARRLSH